MNHIYNPGNAADMVDLVPHLLGFQPDDSLLVLGFSESLGSVGTTRTDLPAFPADWPATADSAIADIVAFLASAGERVGTAVLMVLTGPGTRGDLQHYAKLGQRLAAACARQHIEVAHNLFVNPTHWWSFADAGTARHPGPGTARRPVTAPSRTAVAAQWAPATGADALAAVHAIESALHDLDRELAGGQPVVKQRLRQLLATVLGAPAGSPAPDPDLQLTVQLLLAVQAAGLLDTALIYCEPHELPRARQVWARAASLCVGDYADYAIAPLMLLAASFLLAGDVPSARIALIGAVSAGGGDDESVQDLLAILNDQQAGVVNERGELPAETLLRHLRGLREVAQG
ncbi:DUF4192 domain-containing protein [Kitasatospora sp. NPDC096147]|uniref:DUF4192 domain-containing protein n=1 Tax=Kitasatospora sp. NPDC096147 TaxID=3364093 RepID=UPI00381DEFD5